MICVETRHMRAVLKAQINKTDRNDARGMAQMMRVGFTAGTCENVTQPETADAADPPAVVMHRIWVDGTEFRWTREQAAAAAA